MGSESRQVTFKTGIINNFKNTSIKSIDSVAVASVNAYKTLVGEAEVREFISIVHLGEDHPAYPDTWSTLILTSEWAQSFADAIKDSPKPLFIPGHTNNSIDPKMRAIPDGYVTGGMVIGETLYLRNTLIMEGTEEKKALIEQTTKEISVGMLSTSTSDFMKCDLKFDEDDNATYFATESVKGQSNAIVESDMTGADADIIITSFKANGDSSGENEGDKRMGEAKVLTSVEMFTSLKNQLDSGRLALDQVASGLGIDVMTSMQKTSLKRLEDVESKVGDIAVFVDKTNEAKEATFTSLRDSSIKDKFKSDELIEFATTLFSLKEGGVDEVNGEVERLAGLKMFKTIQGNIAGGVNYVPSGSGDEVITESADTMEA